MVASNSEKWDMTLEKNMGHGNIEYLRLSPVILDMAGGCWRFQISLTLDPPKSGRLCDSITN